MMSSAIGNEMENASGAWAIYFVRKEIHPG